MLFNVTLLSFRFISSENPYLMNFRFHTANFFRKLIVLFVAPNDQRGGLDNTIWDCLGMTHFSNLSNSNDFCGFN